MRSRFLACTVEASDDSSTTRTVLENASRMSLAPFSVSLPSATPALRARNRCSVSLLIPASVPSVFAAEADGASPIIV